LLSEVLALYHLWRHLHRESLAITSPRPHWANETPSWDWAALRSRCVSEASRLLPRHDAEEAVQEALARAWSRRDACRSPEAPLPWLLEITRNESRRVLVRRGRAATIELVDAAPAAGDGDDREMSSAALRLTIEQALGTLADGDRSLLHLRYGEDLTQGEVARRLGMPEGTVKVRLHRARHRLRRLLAE
jgi:RNA polymerase sigma-70 factor (ECF subfamily)